MTDENDPQNDPLIDAEQEAMRRLLAEAAQPDEPMPLEVASRLDDVLAGLVADREAASAPRRSRRWPQVLVAAAAVSVMGYVGVGLANGTLSGGADGEAPTSAVAESDMADSDSAGGAPLESPGENLAEDPAQSPVVPNSGPAAPEIADEETARGLDDKLEAGDELTQGYLLGELANQAFSVGSGSLDAELRSSLRRFSEVNVADCRGRGGVRLDSTPVGRTGLVVSAYDCRRPLLPVATYLLMGAR